MSDNASTVKTYDWSRFTKRISIKSDKKKIYHAIASQSGFEKWFLRKAHFKHGGKLRSRGESIEIRDEYEWLWHGWPDDTVERGTILEANGKDLIRFSFGKAGEVKIAVIEDQGEILVELTQEKIPIDEVSKVFYHLGCTKGWVFYLTNLKSILEGGIDLRNKNVHLKDMINA
jgi:hypothetical protein